MSVSTFKGWCIAYGCQRSLYIGSLDFKKHAVAWRPQYQWNGADLAGSYLLEFGYISTGNEAALPAGIDPGLLSKGTAASNHESGQMAQLTLNVVLGPELFGLPPGYHFTIWDGQAAVVLEDPHNQGLCLWDGVLRQMILAKARPAPAPKPTPAPAPLPTPPPVPAPMGLPPLTPSAWRILEIENRVVAFCLRMVPASWSSLPLAPPVIETAIRGALFALRPISSLLLKTYRRDDPRPMPLEDL